MSATLTKNISRALTAERFVSSKKKRALISIGNMLVLGFAALVLASYRVQELEALRLRLLGAFLMIASLLLILYLLEAYFRSLEMHAVEECAGGKYSFEALCVLHSDSTHSLRAFLSHELGQLILKRAGIPPRNVSALAREREIKSETPSVMDFEHSASRTEGRVTLGSIASALSDAYPAFAQVLAEHAVTKEEFAGTAEWIERERSYTRRVLRWWSREALARIPGIAKDWAYGGTYTLNRFSFDYSSSASLPFISPRRREREIRALEAILARNREANALLIGASFSQCTDVIKGFAREIAMGAIVPVLEHRRVVILETALLLSSMSERAGFERTLLSILGEAERAGNIILVVDNIAALIDEGARIGADVMNVLERALASQHLHLIACTTGELFRTELASNTALLARMQTVEVRELTESELIALYEERGSAIARSERILFTYPALMALIKSALAFPGDEPAEELIYDRLTELVPWALAKNIRVIGRRECEEFLKEKIGVSIGGGIDSAAQVVNLEALLREQVVGQDEALTAVANAVKRNRADIRNLQRPVGSFLFLGPTGVGKTETAKALARVLAGGEDALTRFDMSEYAGADALERLIGDAGTQRAGELATRLHEHPNSVILLDEFEKASREVHNFFLALLDEGRTADAHGKMMNARNALFIATSNAGADHIWWLTGEGRDIAAERQFIIEGIIHDGIFAPELLNRFDAVVLFKPLSHENRVAIAEKLLSAFAKRLKEKGIGLEINAYLKDRVAKAGEDKAFGARPLNRFIQDFVEQLIAEKMLTGELKPGMTVSFAPSEQNWDEMRVQIQN